MTDDLQILHLLLLTVNSPSLMQAVQHYLFTTKGFRVPPSDRSNLPANSIVDHPGMLVQTLNCLFYFTLLSRVLPEDLDCPRSVGKC